MIYVQKGLEWNGSPRRSVANNPCKGSGRRLGTGARKRVNERNFLVSSLCPKTVMINTKTQLGATYRTDAFCSTIFVYLHFIDLNHKVDPGCVFLSVTQGFENHISPDKHYTKSQGGTEH